MVLIVNKTKQTKSAVFTSAHRLLGSGLGVLNALSDHDEVDLCVISISQVKKWWLI